VEVIENKKMKSLDSKIKYHDNVSNIDLMYIYI
jgi:hypothetical protein